MLQHPRPRPQNRANLQPVDSDIIRRAPEIYRSEDVASVDTEVSWRCFG